MQQRAVHRIFRNCGFLLSLAVFLPAPVAAQAGAAHCERARAAAASDASLLLAPTLSLQALRVPTYRGYEPAELAGGDREYQVRAAASWSLATVSDR